jgi:hypothetical protein
VLGTTYSGGYDLAFRATQLGQPIVIAKPYARVSQAIIDLAHMLLDRQGGFPRPSADDRRSDSGRDRT